MTTAVATQNEVLKAIRELAREHGISFQDAAALYQGIRLEELVAAAGRPNPKRSPSGPPILVAVVNIVTAFVAVQGPTMVLPPGATTTIRMRHHTATPGRLGWVAFSQQGITQYDASCVEMKSNDSFPVTCNHWEDMWFDADTASTKFELIAEYGRP